MPPTATFPVAEPTSTVSADALIVTDPTKFGDVLGPLPDKVADDVEIV